MLLTGEQITSLLYYIENYKASNPDVKEISMSLGNDIGCINITFTDDRYSDIFMTTKMFFDRDILPVTVLNYNTFSEYVSFCINQELIRRIDVLNNLK